MARLTEQEQTKVEELQKIHGEVRPYKLGDGRLVVIRAVNPSERVRMVQGITAKADRQGNSRLAETHADIAVDVIVLPESREDRIALLRKWPALNDKFAQDAFDLAEGGIEDLGNA